ncbi:Chromodomain protein, putative isoform 2 [Hibiscus syriacus]|uniref:Chromodomain protein, putative isoform 2 n=1 Tax=Hibiscus syriacus TaxID=106335 RepID=A0A6A2XEL7_HIBSY|nr:chromo domain-containing protein LHP1-like [Hibiscus syriacus]KAE8673788.1 Chromodomain protein, putative isoform 2 [Hibiscus syriacus]
MEGGERKKVIIQGEEEGTAEQIVEGEGLGEKNEEEEVDDDDEEEGEEQEEDNDDGEEEHRTKLDDGFYEIEAIRRKRVRKGELQYLIKWRGWPETSNTWEPLENLQSCCDVIDAFEESLRSGKHNRKRKRKSGGPQIQSKKKQLRSSAFTSNLTSLEVGEVYKSPSVPLEISDAAGFLASGPTAVLAHKGENNRNANNVKKRNILKENGSTSGSKQIHERKDENDYNTKLSDLKVSSNGVNADKLAIRVQERNTSGNDGLTDGLRNVDGVETVKSDRRTGAKRRKSGSVKRFKQDISSYRSNLTQNATPNIRVDYETTDAQMGIENLCLTADGLSHTHLMDNSVNIPIITKILKPVGFSASVSDNNQDVLVTFLAIRSDGKEVMVDNKYLKANNPLLLINFYEQHLKHSPPS